MTRDEVFAFAEEWIRTWNNRDLDTILSHYTEGAQFRSPKAATLVGSPTLVGKAAMASYWRTGLARITRLHFVLDYALWDETRAELLIVYIADLNGTVIAPANPSDSTHPVTSSRVRRCTAFR